MLATGVPTEDAVKKLKVQHLSALLTLFSSALVANKDALAEEFVEMTHILDDVNKMARLAAKMEKRRLSEHVSHLMMMVKVLLLFQILAHICR